MSLCIRNKMDPKSVFAELLTEFTLFKQFTKKMLTQNTCDKQQQT